ncbi:hypothetical protein Patl1_06874 [Pistacia atlantica]|uniref:Uncharacterized protein n=1 Tax=Pistacia atlantica TaxID=434234 RepID=A0ACC1AKV1_9ROSI|nr:hypothetical protein Patl1_06874 [Pistacia atlantica]
MKVLIGCDGANSVVGDFLELKPKKLHSSCAVRGFTYFPNGHGFAHELVRTRRDNTLFGMAPVTDNLACWFVVHQWHLQDSKVFKDQEMIKQITPETIKCFPSEKIQLRGTVTVAGDSMHVMAPFLGQGGSFGIEDAVVLARCMARKSIQANNDPKEFKGQKLIE